MEVGGSNPSGRAIFLLLFSVTVLFVALPIHASQGKLGMALRGVSLQRSINLYPPSLVPIVGRPAPYNPLILSGFQRIGVA